MKTYEGYTIIEGLKVQREACRSLGQNITKLKNRCKEYRNVIENLERNIEEINKLKPNKYYSVEVSYRGSNPMHGAIMNVGFKIHDIVIFNPTYETMAERHCIEDIYRFKVLKEIKEIKEIKS